MLHPARGRAAITPTERKAMASSGAFCSRKSSTLRFVTDDSELCEAVDSIKGGGLDDPCGGPFQLRMLYDSVIYMPKFSQLEIWQTFCTTGSDESSECLLAALAWALTVTYCSLDVVSDMVRKQIKKIIH